MKYAELNRLTNLVERLEIYVSAAAREMSGTDTDYDKWEDYTANVDETKQEILDLFTGKDA
tara:strand:+ start:306 stop:488 length:183 start_codon:yes stop_codon:yes gene_type:complete